MSNQSWTPWVFSKNHGVSHSRSSNPSVNSMRPLSQTLASSSSVIRQQVLPVSPTPTLGVPTNAQGNTQDSRGTYMGPEESDPSITQRRTTQESRGTHMGPEESNHSTTQRRTRGSTRGVRLNKLIKLTGRKPIVEMNIEEGRPTNLYQSRNYITAISIAAREMPLHLDYRVARRQPHAQLAMDRLNSKIELKDNTNIFVVESTMRHMARSNRNRRNKLYRNWKKIGDAAMPADYSLENWKELTTLFGKEEYKGMRERNKANRSLLKRPHITGPTPFAVKRYEISEEELGGEKCGEIKLYFHTHFKADPSDEPDPGSIAGVKGRWSSEWTEMAYCEMIRMHEENPSMTDAEICNEVLNNEGRTDYLVGRGYGYIPQGRKLGHGTHRKMQEELHKAQEMAKKFENDMEERLRIQKEELEEKVARHITQVEHEIEERIRIQMEKEMNERVKTQVAQQFNDMMKTFMSSQTSFFSDSPTGYTQKYKLQPAHKTSFMYQSKDKRTIRPKKKMIVETDESTEDDQGDGWC